MSLGFYVDLKRCIGCKTCQVACKDRHNLLVAGPRPRRVDSYECGQYPDVAMFHLVISCNHCDDPACIKSCPGGALYKAEDGTVQHDKNLCIGCRTCEKVCPYGAPQYLPYQQMIVKCDSCKPLRDRGMNPVCVDACPLRAIEFGEMDALREKHGGRTAESAADAHESHVAHDDHDAHDSRDQAISDGMLVDELPVTEKAEKTRPNILWKASAASLRSDFHKVEL